MSVTVSGTRSTNGSRIPEMPPWEKEIVSNAEQPSPETRLSLTRPSSPINPYQSQYEHNCPDTHENPAPFTQKRNKPSIIRMPATAVMVAEEGMRRLPWFRVLPVKRLAQNPDFPTRIRVRTGWMTGSINPILCTDEHGSRTEHHCRIIQDIIMIKRDQVVDRLRHERVTFLRKHEVI